MRNPRIPLPGSRRSMVAGVAVVTMVASVGATVTGAVRPARSRGGRFYRPTSGVVWTPSRTHVGGAGEVVEVSVGSDEPGAVDGAEATASSRWRFAVRC